MKILCLPYNYQRQETAQITLPDVQYAGKPLYPPQGQPIIVKPDTAYLNNNKPFFIPHHTTLVAAKAQMALRIGKMGRNIDERFALRYINGIGTAVDIVAQNLLLQCEQQRAPWSMATGFDGSAPVSGFIGDITEADNSEVVMRINDAEKQRFTTSSLLLGAAQVVTYTSRFFTLHTGDIILTGSPCEQIYLNINDVIDVTLNDTPMMHFRIK